MTAVASPSGAAVERCVHELFEEQVARTPHRTALRYCGRDTTFHELDARAGRISACLLEHGVGPGMLIGVLLERSPDAIAAILGVLKTGAGYVALEPTFPTPRLREIIADAAMPIVVTVDRLADAVPAGATRVMSLDRLPDVAARTTAGRCHLDDLAYATYTSGSSGAPKGVLLTHRSITNRLADVPFDPNDPTEVSALTSPLSFGFSVSRTFLPLLTGVPNVIVPEAHVRNGARFIELLETEVVTSIALVTPHLRELLRLGPDAMSRLHRLRTVTTGGAVVSEDLVAQFQAALPHVVLIDVYGMSETGCAAAVGKCRGDSGGADVPRTAFPNTRILVLDPMLRPVRPGDIGEIYIEAAHLARGYLASPGLTAARFVPEPSGSTPGRRMYRTGDGGRQFADGRLEITGRVDDQVKVRGYRVALPEVEAVLGRHPRVVERAVIAASTGDDTRIVAYVVGDGLESDELRHYMRARVPDFMVPDVFVRLESLPLNANGKIDRMALAHMIPAGNDGTEASARCALIEEAIRRCPGVERARVMPRAAAGRTVYQALVELRSDCEGLLPRHIKAMVARTSPSLVPARVTFVAALPGAADQVRHGSEVQGDARRHNAGSRQIEAQLLRAVIALYEETLGRHGVGPDDSLVSLGASSLQAIRLTFHLEARFGIRTSLDTFPGQRICDLVKSAAVLHTAPKLDMQVTRRPPRPAGRSRGTALASSPERRRYLESRAAAIDRLLQLIKQGALNSSLDEARRLVPLYPDLLYLTHLVQILERAPVSGVPTFTDDPHAELQIARGDGTGDVVLAFCGAQHAFGLPLALFDRWVAPLGATVVYLRDFRHVHYFAGLGRFGADRRATVDGLASLIGPVQGRRVFCMGMSAGAAAAILYGLDLGATSVVAFAGPLDFSESVNEHLGTKHVAARLRAEFPEASVDLRDIYRQRSGLPRTLVVYGDASWDDRLQAERLAGVAAMSHLPIEHCSEHNVIGELIRRDWLTPLLKWLLAPNSVELPPMVPAIP